MGHLFKSAFLCVALLATAATAREPALTAPGPAEDVQDLADPPSPDEKDRNDLTVLQGLEISGRGGVKIGELTDIIVDRSGSIRQIVISLAGAGDRAMNAETLPFAGRRGEIAMTKAEVEQLPEFTEPASGHWSTANLIGAGIRDRGGSSIADIRFSERNVERVVLEVAGDEVFEKTADIPFSALVLSGSATEPDVALTEDGRRRLPRQSGRASSDQAPAASPAGPSDERMGRELEKLTDDAETSP